MPWDRVHAEAEVLEHVLSEDLEELIAAKLGHPTVDPHGDPIPSADLELEERATDRMESLQPGDEGLFVRVSDSDPEMLRYLADRGISPGDRFAVRDRQPFGGPAVRASSASASTRSAASSPARCVSSSSARPERLRDLPREDGADEHA